mmetsp:Transcript_2515/g.4424  ORF Transcript_2515/g.4424 Transcript_2515/m.4424 type:complete len:113 (-) Transcript_2515:1530-1868(-)
MATIYSRLRWRRSDPSCRAKEEKSNFQVFFKDIFIDIYMQWRYIQKSMPCTRRTPTRLDHLEKVQEGNPSPPALASPQLPLCRCPCAPPTPPSYRAPVPAPRLPCPVPAPSH